MTNLEQNVEKETKKLKKKHHPWLRTLTAMSLSAIIGYSAGRLQESQDRWAYQLTQKAMIMDAASEGYTFKPDADPDFFRYHQVLFKDNDKTMIGVQIKDDGTLAGPIRKGGRVGFTTTEKALIYSKERLEELEERGKDLYQDIVGKVDSLRQEYFGKDSVKTR